MFLPLITFGVCLCAEAACKHLVELARAEVQANDEPSRAMREFAKIRLEDAERGCHKVLNDHGLILKVKVDYAQLGEDTRLKQFPMIKFSSWVQHLLDNGRLARQLVGVSSMKKMKGVLVEYWRRLQVIDPRHFVFDLAAQGHLQLGNTIPFFTHSDEGRSLKHQPVFVLSCHGCLGRGTRAYLQSGKHRAPLQRNGMGLNFAGQTWATQFLVATMMRSLAVGCPDAFKQLIQLFAEDVKTLWEEGVRSSDGRHQVWLVHMNTKGDLPALKTMGNLKRSFSNVARGPSSKKACLGICHMCLAGQEATPQGAVAIPFEDVNRDADWMLTLNVSIPWDHTPPIFAGMPDSSQRASFFATDIWHNFHLVLGKGFVACSWACIVESSLPSLPAGSVETRFAHVTVLYKQYFSSKKIVPFVSEISRDTMNFPQSNAIPVGKWSKASATTEMMLFLSDFGSRFIRNNSADPLLLAIVSSWQVRSSCDEVKRLVLWVLRPSCRLRWARLMP